MLLKKSKRGIGISRAGVHEMGEMYETSRNSIVTGK